MKLAKILTSMYLICIAVLMYISGYAIKASAFLNTILVTMVPNPDYRMAGAVFTSVSISIIILAASIHLKNYKFSIPLAIFDAFLLILVLDSFSIQLTIIQRVERIFIACFMAFLYFILIEVFKTKLSEELAKHEQKEAKEVQKAAEDKLKKALACDFCEKPHTTIQAKNAHIGRCQYNPVNQHKEAEIKLLSNEK